MSIEIENHITFRSLPEIQPHLGAFPSKSVDECRRLVARRYLDFEYIAPQDINENGFIDNNLDPYVNRSEYFWKKDDSGNIEATLRVIHTNPHDRDDQLPIEKSFELYDIQALQLRETLETDPLAVGEISALAKEEGVESLAAIDMYREVWQFAKRSEMKLCAISADYRLYNFLTSNFGSAIVQAGDPAHIMGSETYPCLLFPDDRAEAMVEIYNNMVAEVGEDAAESYKGLIAYLRYGLEEKYLSATETDALKGIGIE